MRGLLLSGVVLGALAMVPGNIGKKTRAIRNNNPGNLRYYAIGWIGETGQDEDGFSVFDSMESGARAAYINMRTKYYRDGVDTIAELIPVWAPAHENDTEAYIQYVSNRTGIAPNEPFNIGSQGPEILAAIFRFEAGEEISQNVILEGVLAA